MLNRQKYALLIKLSLKYYNGIAAKMPAAAASKPATVVGLFAAAAAKEAAKDVTLSEGAGSENYQLPQMVSVLRFSSVSGDQLQALHQLYTASQLENERFYLMQKVGAEVLRSDHTFAAAQGLRQDFRKL